MVASATFARSPWTRLRFRAKEREEGLQQAGRAIFSDDGVAAPGE
jgi:hypothetical protein